MEKGRIVSCKYNKPASFQYKNYVKIIKGLFVEVLPSANNVARARSFLQCHFCNVILIRRIILIFCFGQNHRHRPHSCPCRQNHRHRPHSCPCRQNHRHRPHSNYTKINLICSMPICAHTVIKTNRKAYKWSHAGLTSSTVCAHITKYCVLKMKTKEVWRNECGNLDYIHYLQHTFQWWLLTTFQHCALKTAKHNGMPSMKLTVFAIFNQKDKEELTEHIFLTDSNNT